MSNANADCPSAQLQAVQDLFDSQQLVATVVTSPEAYGEALRSGFYNLLWLHGDLSDWSQQQVVETKAAAMRGMTLVLDGPPHAHSAAFASLWKGGFGDAPLQGEQTLRIDGGDSISLSGPAWALQTGRAQVVSRYEGDLPAILSADAGLGMVYVTGFDLLGHVASYAPLAQWVANQITEHLAPPVVEPMLAASQVELVTTMHNQGDVQRALQLHTTLPNGATIIDVKPEPSAVQAEQVTWRSSLDSDQQSRTVIRVSLPPQAQASVLHTVLTDTQTAQELQHWQFTVRTVDLATVQAQVDALLGTAVQHPALADIRAAVQAAHDTWDNGQIEHALAELSSAFVLAEALDEPDSHLLQIALSQWLGLATDGAVTPLGHGIEAFTGWGQSAMIDEAFAQVLVARVTNAAQRPVAGERVHFVLPDSGASAHFGSGALHAEAYTDAQGLAYAPVMQANSVAGDFEALAQLPDMISVTPARFPLSNRAANTYPAVLEVVAGHAQSAYIQQAFAQTLQVRVSSEQGPLAAQEVLFTFPARGASARFVGGQLQARALTDAQGLASSPAFTANGEQGSYHATASVAGALSAVQFELNNLSPTIPIHTLQVHDGDGQAATVNTSYAQPLRVRITDTQGLPVAGHRVRFNAPTSGPSVLFAGGDPVLSEVLTDDQGIATTPAMSANAESGAFVVLVSAEQVHEGVALHLHNQPTQTPDERHFSAATPTGTGTVSVSVSGGGPLCRFSPGNTSVRRAQGLLPLFEVLLFPHGVLDFELIDCEPGSTVMINTEWPDLQHITGYLKYGPTPSSQGRSIWYVPSQLHVAGRVIRYAITDGGLGDDDLVANGRIRDPGGPVIQSGPLPGLDQPQSTRPIPADGMAWLLGAAAGLVLLALWQGRAMRRRSKA